MRPTSGVERSLKVGASGACLYVDGIGRRRHRRPPRARALVVDTLRVHAERNPRQNRCTTLATTTARMDLESTSAKTATIHALTRLPNIMAAPRRAQWTKQLLAVPSRSLDGGASRRRGCTACAR